MCRFSKLAVATIFGSLSALCIISQCIAADPAPVVENPNTATITRIELTPTPPRATFKVEVKDPKQPVSLRVGPTNSFAVVSSQLVSGLKGQASLTQIEPVESTIDKAGVKQPHLFRLNFRDPTSFELSLNEDSFVVIPQYYVVATKVAAPTKLTCDLLVHNNSPNPLADAKVSFRAGGLTLPENAVLNLSVGHQFPLPARFEVPAASGPPTITDDRELAKPLAYWAKEADFGGKDPAKAELQLPMKGNWPKELTIPGWIHFSFDGQKLPSFSTLADFPTVIGKEFQSFKGAPLPAEYGAVTLTETKQNAISSIDKWPQIDFDVFTDFASSDQTGKPVWLKMNDSTNSNLTYDPTGTPKNPVKTIVTQKSANLLVYPGEETANALAARTNFLAGLVTRQRAAPADSDLEKKRQAMLTELKPVVEFLKQTQPLVVKEETRIKELEKAVRDLAATDADAVNSRSKLVQAQRSLESLIDSYNTWVMAHPK